MKRILNVGCGDDTYGTDFVDKYPKRSEVKKCDLDKDKIPFEANTFDVVYSKYSFEHLTNHPHFLREVKRVLKKSGKLVLITDNANYWLWSVCKTKHGKNILSDEDTYHYSLFCPEHIINRFRKHGFDIIDWYFIDAKGDSFFIKLINHFLRLTPFRRMSFHGFKVIGEK